MFEYVLDNVIAVLISDKVLDAGVNLDKNQLALLLGTILQYALNDTATVWMRRHVVHFALLTVFVWQCDRVENEAQLSVIHFLYYLLYDVIAVLILHTFKNVSA